MLDFELKEEFKKKDICTILDTLYHVVSDDIEENIETEKLAGPFNEDWEKGMIFKQEMKKELRDLTVTCKDKRNIRDYK